MRMAGLRVILYGSATTGSWGSSLASTRGGIDATQRLAMSTDGGTMTAAMTTMTAKVTLTTAS
jgi:hypothetical protein